MMKPGKEKLNFPEYKQCNGNIFLLMVSGRDQDIPQTLFNGLFITYFM